MFVVHHPTLGKNAKNVWVSKKKFCVLATENATEMARKMDLENAFVIVDTKESFAKSAQKAVFKVQVGSAYLVMYLAKDHALMKLPRDVWESVPMAGCLTIVVFASISTNVH
ncbi:hypothetical protein RF11_00735 [Thelohanellus kitauei]|uniref:Uncharacterized protein n=1 Tax=Thelohanellus kitauei TaxID=669202 RepID=A0A0C2N4W3_THEKT|nr:hypothetical protein RF11_00735 [Thelohanellus kitauei]